MTKLILEMDDIRSAVDISVVDFGSDGEFSIISSPLPVSVLNHVMFFYGRNGKWGVAWDDPSDFAPIRSGCSIKHFTMESTLENSQLFEFSIDFKCEHCLPVDPFSVNE